MAKFYFLKTVMSKGQLRMRFLDGQKTESGKTISTSLNVKCDKLIRSKYPVGSIFYTTAFSEVGKYYDAPSVSSMNVASKEVRDEYKKYQGLTSKSTPEEPKLPKTLYETLKEDVCKRPTIEEDGFFIKDEDWLILLRNIKQKVNTLMTGPTGSGKTSIIKLACEKLGIPLSVYDMGSMFDPVSGLLGVHRLQEGGVSIFDYAKFTDDIQKPGVILLDEISRAPVTSNNILFPCLDDRRVLPVEIAGGKDLRSIPIHPEVCFIATANIGSEYTGTMMMDRALHNRFFPLELDYIPKSEESKVLQKRCGIPKDTANLIVTVAQQIRDVYRKQEISCSVSTRETLMVSQLVADGWSLAKALELILLPLYEGTSSEGERGTIKKILMAY